MGPYFRPLVAAGTAAAPAGGTCSWALQRSAGGLCYHRLMRAVAGSRALPWFSGWSGSRGSARNPEGVPKGDNPALAESRRGSPSEETLSSVSPLKSPAGHCVWDSRQLLWCFQRESPQSLRGALGPASALSRGGPLSQPGASVPVAS